MLPASLTLTLLPPVPVTVRFATLIFRPSALPPPIAPFEVRVRVPVLFWKAIPATELSSMVLPVTSVRLLPKAEARSIRIRSTLVSPIVNVPPADRASISASSISKSDVPTASFPRPMVFPAPGSRERLPPATIWSCCGGPVVSLS